MIDLFAGRLQLGLFGSQDLELVKAREPRGSKGDEPTLLTKGSDGLDVLDLSKVGDIALPKTKQINHSRPVSLPYLILCAYRHLPS
jgi:hypothetical protein